ncbi:hypothetical protein BKA65DRAFT_37368 [Rhexocercosporidium sp. MPI-PUGE-AT-0058]|nr:hypothetical protein BKA65DRAFT_37368 [Rhexocercosporidium sp. MPI-PUGE-AT-0058]
MASVDDTFRQVIEKFTARLTKEEKENFKFTSLEDVLAVVEDIQAEQGQKRSMMNLTRIQRFLEAMHQYGTVIEVFLNASSILCFVWGPMKFCIMIASSWADSFDMILDAYQQLAENLPLFADYQSLFGSDPRMRSILSLIYEDILEFHQVALRVLKRPTWKQLFRAAWKDFESRFRHIINDLRQHKELIESHATIAQIRETRAEREYVRNQFTMAEEARQQQRRIDLIAWISATNPVLDHEAAISVRSSYPGSGKWLLQESKMKTWLDHTRASTPILWMHGIPGAGKTILASVIVQECQRSPETSVIYFYCDYQDEERKTFISIARALLVQLLNQIGDLLPYLYEKCIGSGQVSLLSTALCQELLGTALKTVTKKTYIIIDGLDECPLKERRSLLSFITSCIDKEGPSGSLRGLLVSQDENDIRKLLRTASTFKLTTTHNQPDIESYAQHWLIKIQAKFELSPETISYIKAAVCEGSEGMFLFAKLVLTNLYDQLTAENLYQEIRPGTFPKGFEKAYSRIVVRIYQNPNIAQRETAKRLLGWITSSKRALKWHEIQGAISMNTQDQTVDFKNRRLCADVRDICGSLIEVLPGDRVQLVHGTAKLYLVHNDYVQIHNEEHKLATLCLKYLLFDCFDPNLSEDSIKEYTMLGYYAFQDYAILHWIDHLEASIPFMLTDVVDKDDGLDSAINDFSEAYGSVETGASDIKTELRDRCQHLKDTDVYDNILLLLSHTRTIRSKEETISALGVLGTVISKTRFTLEKLQAATLSGTLPVSIKANLEQYYGTNWFKCLRHSCIKFHEGFSNAASRDSHANRHEKPYLCTESSCTRKYVGFSTEKDLKRHLTIMHPDPSVLFPKIKKPPAKHVCDVCSKDFTRAHNLNAHKRTHDNVRPYTCVTCGKTFVRKFDCERHMDKLHPEQKKKAAERDDSLDSPRDPETSTVSKEMP